MWATREALSSYTYHLLSVGSFTYLISGLTQAQNIANVPRGNTTLYSETWLLLMQMTQVWSLGWDDPLKKEVATHSSVLAWKIPWTEESGRLQSMGSQSCTWLRKQAHMHSEIYEVSAESTTVFPEHLWILFYSPALNFQVCLHQSDKKQLTSLRLQLPEF